MDVYQRRRLVALSAIAALFVIFVLLIRSCGDDEAPVTTTPVSGATLGGAAPTLDAYIQEADAICLQANTLIADLDTSDPQQAAIDQANAVGSELQSVQTLTVPTDDADDVDSVLKALEKFSENLNDRVVAYENGDTTAVAELDIAVEEAQSKVGKRRSARARGVRRPRGGRREHVRRRLRQRRRKRHERHRDRAERHRVGNAGRPGADDPRGRARDRGRDRDRARAAGGHRNRFELGRRLSLSALRRR